jgi:heme oxygenase
MATGRIDRDTYAAGLGPLLALHKGLEAALAAAHGAPEVAAVYDPCRMTRGPLLAADRVALGEVPAPAAANVAIGRLADEFHEWAEFRPWALIGALYVTEGSRMGSMLLARSLSAAFGVRPELGVGLDYHVAGIATRPADWQRFKAAVNALPLAPARAVEVLGAAVVTMNGLVEMYAALPAGIVETVSA